VFLKFDSEVVEFLSVLNAGTSNVYGRGLLVFSRVFCFE
jgi:hypothetical protein